MRPPNWMTTAMSLGASMALHGSTLAAQTPGRVPGGCEAPAANRPSEIGCYHVHSDSVATLPAGPVYWHIYEIPGGRATAESVSRPATPGVAVRSAVQALGRSWVFAIAGRDWEAGTGTRTARVGPLPPPGPGPYVVRYMEAVFAPGMLTAVHTHSGPEAWYVVEGSQCLQTPDTTIVARAGQDAVVSAGPPMRLSGIGSGTRRALVLVLHDGTRPWTTLHREWAPGGPCVTPP